MSRRLAHLPGRATFGLEKLMELMYVASGTLVLVGVGHTVVELWMGSRPPAEELVPAMEIMKERQVAFPGRRVPLFDLMRGFSLAMGCWLVAFGGLNLLLPLEVAKSPTVLAWNILFSAMGAWLAFRYFFVVPLVGMVVALVCYGLTWLM
jgi:hypothetical protein